MDDQAVQFDYRVKAVQNENRICKISSVEVETPVECAASPEFQNGISGMWTPETYFLAAAAGSYVNTYQSLCDELKMKPISLECEASGTVALVDQKYAFSGVMLNPIITVANHDDEEIAYKVIETAHLLCPIANSIKCPVSVSENVLVLVH